MKICPAAQADCEAKARIQADNYRRAYRTILPLDYQDQFNCTEQAQDWQGWLAISDLSKPGKQVNDD